MFISVINLMKIDRSVWTFIATIFFVSLLLYWPNPRMGFVLDDHYVIERNPMVKTSSLYSQILTTGLFSSAHRTPESGLNYYRPLLTASFALDYQFWGLHAFGYRLMNILLHALNSLLVFLLLDMIFKKRELAALAALIFCILPVHEWVVRYIVGRGDSLQALMTLISLVAISRGLALRTLPVLADAVGGKRTPCGPPVERSTAVTAQTGNLWMLLSLISFIAALLSREVAVLNVAYIFLVTYFLTKDFKETIKVSALFVGVAVVYYVLRLIVLPIAGHGLSLDLWYGLLLAFSYCLRFLSPSIIQVFLPEYITVMILLTMGIFITIKIAKSQEKSNDRAVVLFALAWIVLGILPLMITQRIVERLGPVLSEHFLYLGAIGFALLLAWLLGKIEKVFIRKALCVFFISYYLCAGFVNGYFWQNEEKLLRHVRTMEASEFTVADEQIAMRFDDDQNKIKRLIELSPSAVTRSVWLKRLGNIDRAHKDSAGAIKALNAAVAADPQNVEALNELAVAYWETGQMPQGFAAINQALKVDPHNSEGYRLLGITFYLQGDFARARAMLNLACAYDPQDQQALNLLHDVEHRALGTK